jgi:Aspartyl protease
MVIGSAVSFATMRHTVLVHAVLNHQEPVTLLLDTGATHTLLTPDITRRLGISPEPDAPRNSMATLGSQEGELPLIRLASLAVGEAAVEDLQVEVFTALPHTPFIDGLLGGRLSETLHAATRLCTESAATDPAGHARHVVAHRDLASCSRVEHDTAEVLDNHMLV